MSTKNDLLAAWVELTGDDLREARHRIRVLSEAGLLPQRAAPLTYDDLARALLGFLLPETHKDAPKAVLRFSEFRCTAFEGGGDENLASGSLLRAISLALRPPFSVVALHMQPEFDTVDLIAQRNDDPFSVRSYYFGSIDTKPPKKIKFPIRVRRSMYSDLIDKLLPLMRDNSQDENAVPPGREAGVRA